MKRFFAPTRYFLKYLGAFFILPLILIGCQDNLTAPSPETESDMVTNRNGSDASTSQCDAVVSSGESIQNTIDKSSGGVICVEAGTYAEPLTIDVENLILRGPNAGTAGYEARNAEATVEGQVVLSANGATLDGFDVSPPPAESNSEAEAVRVSNTPDDVVVKNNIVRDFGENGLDQWEGVEGIVAFGGVAEDPIDGVTISKNKVENLEGRDVDGGTAGIMIQGNVERAVVDDNVVSNVGLEATAWAHGIVITYTENHDEVPSDVTVSNNVLHSILSAPESELAGVGVGVESDGAGYDITENTIEENNLGVEVKEAADKTTVNENNIGNNTQWGALNRDTETLDSECNWWGNSNGPDHRNTNDVKGGVQYDPWSIRPIGNGWNADRHCKNGGPGTGTGS